MNNIERFVEKYGEKYRLLITDSLEFLEVFESTLNLKEKLDKDKYIEDIMERVKK